MDKKKQIKFNMNNFLLSSSMALDFMQHHRIGTTLGHAKRVAYIALNIGIKYDLKPSDLSDLCTYALSSNLGLNGCFDEKSFCEIANESVKKFIFQNEKKDILLYQKESFDGRGVFGKKGEEIPLFSQIIYLAKILDDRFDFGIDDIQKRFLAIEFVKENINIRFSSNLVEKFFECANDITFWQDMLNENDTLLFVYNKLEDFTIAVDFEDVLNITMVFHYLDNFSSKFVDVCAVMTDFYEFEHKDKFTFLIAASMCNIGKLSIDRKILDKKESLSIYEIEKIKAYPYYTRKILNAIMGFNDITSWAIKIQERLDGSGYILGLEGKDLTFKDRLLACMHAYNAIRGRKEYREPFTHKDAIEILKFEASENKFDEAIIKDIEEVFKES